MATAQWLLWSLVLLLVSWLSLLNLSQMLLGCLGMWKVRMRGNSQLTDASGWHPEMVSTSNLCRLGSKRYERHVSVELIWIRTGISPFHSLHSSKHHLEPHHYWDICCGRRLTYQYFQCVALIRLLSVCLGIEQKVLLSSACFLVNFAEEKRRCP